MAKVVVLHKVADYDQWYPVFTEHESVRRQYGATGHRISREAADPNSVLVINDFATMDGAKGFATDPSVPTVMARAGVQGRPQIWFVEESESKAY